MGPRNASGGGSGGRGELLSSRSPRTAPPGAGRVVGAAGEREGRGRRRRRLGRGERRGRSEIGGGGGREGKAE
eukprot:8200042-Pyramimonas_sp.AAC.1